MEVIYFVDMVLLLNYRIDEATHRKKRKITMATLQYRGAEVTSEKAVVKPKTKTAIYRGVTYDPAEIKKAVPTIKSGMYRGSAWEA
jgi:hypothetical protein